MLSIPSLDPHSLLVISGLPQSEIVLEVIARLALVDTVQVIVAGNRFNAHKLARIVRRHTLRVDHTLSQIQQARPFTCYQVLTLLENTQPSTPVVMLDMLTPFYDDNITDADSLRLVTAVVKHLHRLSREATVLVTLCPSAPPARAGLATIVQAAADSIYHYEPPMQAIQPTLFTGVF